MASELKKTGQILLKEKHMFITSLTISVTASLKYNLRGEIEFQNYPKGLLPYQTVGKEVTPVLARKSVVELGLALE